MSAKYYLCVTIGGVEFGIDKGPFETPEERLAEARRIFKSVGVDEDNIFNPDNGDNLFWLDIDENGTPTMCSFLCSDFVDDWHLARDEFLDILWSILDQKIDALNDTLVVEVFNGEIDNAYEGICQNKSCMSTMAQVGKIVFGLDTCYYDEATETFVIDEDKEEIAELAPEEE